MGAGGKKYSFVNTSDEVAEGIGSSGENGYDLGIMLSSKLRLCELGYHFEPIYELDPFAAVYTPNSVMLVAGGKNTNSAKLFVRFLLGETDGTGKGYMPFLHREHGHVGKIYKMAMMSA